MKKIITIQLLAGSLSLPALSQVCAAQAGMPALANGLSRLSLSNYDHQKFVLYFDNSYFSTLSNTYNVTDITPGRHHIRMMSPLAQQNPYGAWGMPQLFYDGYVNIPANSLVTAYTQGDVFNITSTVPLYDQYGYYDPDYNYGYGSAGGNSSGQWNGNGYDPYGYGNNGGNWGNNGGWNYGNGCGNSSVNGGWNYPQYQGMSSTQFDALKATIVSKPFDSSKRAVAEQAVASNYLTAVQVTELTKLFDFESTKLDFAKYAYGRTIDKGNYYQVNNAFDFESSITDLAGYVNSYHG